MLTAVQQNGFGAAGKGGNMANHIPWPLRATSALCAALCLASWNEPVRAASETWRIDPKNSSIEFVVKNMGLPVKGKLTKFAGAVSYDGKNLNTSTVVANIDPSSIDTGIGARDHHLKSKDFFNVAKFSQLEFRSTKVVADSSGAFDVTGSLTMHGVPEEVILHAKPLSRPLVGQDGKTHLSTSATAQLNRKDFSIGGIMAASISNQVEIQMHIDLLKDQ